MNNRTPSSPVIASVLCLLAAGCGQKGGDAAAPAQGAAPPPLPLTTAATPASALAPPPSQLPKAPRPRIVRVASASDEYAYVDQAEAMGEALDAAPPDYTFDYDGVRPWVWRTSGDDLRLSEPVDGGYRVYFFRRGARYPYLIQDPRYAYGFDEGQLAAVYGPSGALLSDQYRDEMADEAGRYLARAQALRDAALHADRQAVAAQAWAERSAALLALQAAWSRQQQRDLAWNAYHEQHRAQFDAYYGEDRANRRQYADQFAAWRSSDFQGPPPPPRGVEANGPPPAGAAGVAAGAVGALLGARRPPPPPPAAGPRPGPEEGRPPGQAGRPPEYSGGAPNGHERQGPPPPLSAPGYGGIPSAAPQPPRREGGRGDAARAPEREGPAAVGAAPAFRPTPAPPTPPAHAFAAPPVPTAPHPAALQDATRPSARPDAGAYAPAGPRGGERTPSRAERTPPPPPTPEAMRPPTRSSAPVPAAPPPPRAPEAIQRPPPAVAAVEPRPSRAPSPPAPPAAQAPRAPEPHDRAKDGEHPPHGPPQP